MKLSYRAEIDGLRAIAVLPVILFHAGFTAFSGGFVGVDVFFVISGYLITSIIAQEIEAGSFSFRGFYERRARRILPVLFLVMLCCIPFSWMWMMPLEFNAFSTSVVSVCLSLSNVLFWRQSGYFEAAGEYKPLLHTWSLAVEEQFYIIFPIAILLLWRLGRTKAKLCIVLVAVLSLTLSEYASRYHPSFNFYWLPTRAWELMAGALCAFASIKPYSLRDNILSIAGLVAIAISVFVYDETIPFPSLFALVPVLGACAVIIFGRDGNTACNLLSVKPLVGVGLISYSAYLWHQPLFAFARVRSPAEPSSHIMLLLAISSLLLAYLSWRFVEMPVRARSVGALSSSRSVIVMLSATATVLIAAGLAGHLNKGFPSRMSDSILRVISSSDDGNARSGCLSELNSKVLPSQSCIYGNEQKVHMALLGDSHAHALAFALGRELSERSGQPAGFRELTHSGCPPISSYRRTTHGGLYDCDQFYAAAMEFLASNPDINIVLIWARWQIYVEFAPFNNGEGGIETGGKVIPDRSAFRTSSDIDVKVEIGKLYQKSIEALLAMGKRVVLIYPQPEVGWNVPLYLSKSMLIGLPIKRPLSTSYERFKIRTSFAYDQLDSVHSEKIIRVYPERIFCNTFLSGRCVAEDGRSPFYLDDDHVNFIGASRLATEIVHVLKESGWI